MQDNRNILKKEILEYLRAGKATIGWDIIRAVGRENHSVRNALLRLRRNYLVSVDKIRGGPTNRIVFSYMITEKGLKRLSFYQEEEKTKRKAKP